MTFHIADCCGSCDRCSSGLSQKCRRLFKYGHARTADGSGLNGCYASHILIRAGTHVVRIPPHVTDRMAAPVNCALATMVAATAELRKLAPSAPRARALVQVARDREREKKKKKKKKKKERLAKKKH